MNFDIRYGQDPADAIHYDTATMRERFLVERPFATGELRLAYSHTDRVIFGGAVPTTAALALEGGKELGTERFLDRRELGVVCIAGKGKVVVDGTSYAMTRNDGLYVGRGAASVSFESEDPAAPARFWLMSAPAHRTCPTVHIPEAKANPRKLGTPEAGNVRTIRQYVHPAVCESCQLVMGVTTLEPGSLWNTFPPHTHERRMEVYLYFGMEPSTRVFHFHGRPEETRHIVMANEQAVISPSWSIHSGVGTGAYSFIWGMAGENQTFDDMDGIDPSALR